MGSGDSDRPIYMTHYIYVGIMIYMYSAHYSLSFLSAQGPQGLHESLWDQRIRGAKCREPYCDLG